ETQRLLHLPFRRRVQPGQPDLHRLLFEPDVADEALDILLDGIAQLRCLLVRTQAGERGKVRKIGRRHADALSPWDDVSRDSLMHFSAAGTRATSCRQL